MKKINHEVSQKVGKKLSQRLTAAVAALAMSVSFMTSLAEPLHGIAAAPTNGAILITDFNSEETYFKIGGNFYDQDNPVQGGSANSVGNVELNYDFEVKGAGGMIPGTAPHLYIDATTLKTTNGAGFNWLSASNTLMYDKKYSSSKYAATFTLDEDGYIQITLTDDYIDYLKSGSGDLTGSLMIKVELDRDKTEDGDRVIKVGNENITVVFDDKGAEVNTKMGTLDRNNNQINWSVIIDNSSGLDLKDYVLVDSMDIGMPTANGLDFVKVSDNEYKITTENATASQYTITYSTPLTAEMIKAGSVTNKVSLQKNGKGKEVPSNPVTIDPPFNVQKDGAPDYQTGKYNNKINWKVTITRNYDVVSLDGYSFTDVMLDGNWQQSADDTAKLEAALAQAKVSPQGSISKNADGKWVFSGTGNAEQVVLEYNTPAEGGKKYNNKFTLDGRDIYKDVEYKDKTGFYTINKGGNYNRDTKEITWNVNIQANDGQNLKDYKFTDDMLSKRIGDFGGNDTSRFTCSGNTITVNESVTSLNFTYVTKVDISDKSVGGFTEVNKYKGEKDGVEKEGEGTVYGEVRENLTKQCLSGSEDSVYTSGSIEKVLSWKVKITEDKKLSTNVYHDVLSKEDNASHDLIDSSLVVKAGKTEYGAYTTLVAGVDYNLVKTDTGFDISFVSPATDDYNYAEITYDTKATVKAGGGYRKYDFKNKGEYGNGSGEVGFKVEKKDPHEGDGSLEVTIQKNWNNKPDDAPDNVTFRVRYRTDKGSEGYVKYSDGQFIFKDDAGYDSAPYYQLKITAGESWKGKISDLPKQISTVDPVTQNQTSVTKYFYTLEEYKIGDQVTTGGKYLQLSDGTTYKIEYSNENFSDNASIYVTNTYYSKINITAKKEWTGDAGSGNNASEVVLELQYSFDNNGNNFKAVRTTDNNDFLLETDSNYWSSVPYRITLTKADDWKKEISNLTTLFYDASGNEKNCVYRLVEIEVDGKEGKNENGNRRFDEDGTGCYYLTTDSNNGIKTSDEFVVSNEYHTPKNLTLTGKKNWKSDPEAARPDIIYVQLQQRVENSNEWKNLGEPKQVTAADNWQYTFDGVNPAMPDFELKDGEMVKYVYRVREVGYHYAGNDTYPEKSETLDSESDAYRTRDVGGFYKIRYQDNDIINTYVEPKIELTPKKTWQHVSEATLPDSVQFKLKYRYESDPWDEWSDYKDASGNSVVVTLDATDANSNTDTSTGVVTDVWQGTMMSLPSQRLVAVADTNPAKYTTEKIYYKYVEVVNGKEYGVGDKYDGSFGSIDAKVEISGDGQVENGSDDTATVSFNLTNNVKEDIGINKHIVDKKGEELPGSIKLEDLAQFKRTFDGKEYYVFNWYIAFDGKDRTKVMPVKDKLPEGHSLVYNHGFTTQAGWDGTFVDHSTPFTTGKQPNGYYELPTWVWTKTDGSGGGGCNPIDNLKSNASDVWVLNGNGEAYFEDTTDSLHHVLYLSHPNIDPGYMIEICYSTKILCTDLEAQMGDSKYYTIANRAIKIGHDGVETDKTDSASLTIVNEKPLITKEYQTTPFPGYIQYTLKVNPEAKNLSTGDTIDITDVFTTSKYFDHDAAQKYYPQSEDERDADPERYKHLVDVLMDSMTLYEIVDGEEVLMSKEQYQYQFESNKSVSEGAALLKLVIPDEKTIKIVYEYKIIGNENTPSVNNKCGSGVYQNRKELIMQPGMVPPIGDSITFSNKAELRTESVYDWAERKEDEYIVPESTGILSTNELPKIIKVDVGNETISSLNNEYYLVNGNGTKYATPIPKNAEVAESEKISKTLMWGSSKASAKILSTTEANSALKAATNKGMDCKLIDAKQNMNAKFLLAKYESDGWHYATEVKDNEVIKWGEESFTGNNIDPNAKTLDLSGAQTYTTSLNEGTLCKLIEVDVPEGYEGSNLGLSSEQFRELIEGYVQNGTTTYNGEDYTIFLNKFKAVSYFAFNRKPTAYPDDFDSAIKAEFEKNRNIVSSGGNINVKDCQLIDLGVTKNWVQPVEGKTTVTVELYWSYTKNTYKIPDDAVLADAETLGIIDLGFEATKTIPAGTNEKVWENLPNGIDDSPIYYYVKETAYTVGSQTYTLQPDGSYEDELLDSIGYRPTYLNNAANEDQMVVVNNSKELLLKKKWVNNNGEEMQKAPVPNIKVSIYGIKDDDTDVLLFDGIELSETNSWTADITSKIAGRDLSIYKRLDARETNNGTTLTNYVVSCVFKNNGNTGEIEVQNKSIVPTNSTLKVQKVWNDGAELHESGKIGIQIWRSIAVLTAEEVTGLTKDNVLLTLKTKDVNASDVTDRFADTGETVYWLSDANDWRATFSDLELQDVNGNRYYYYVVEVTTENVVNADKYAVSYTADTKTLGSTKYVITNARNMLTIQKKWYDEDGKEIKNTVDKAGNVVEDKLSKLPEVEVKVAKREVEPIDPNIKVPEKSYSDIANERDYVNLVDVCKAVTPSDLREDGCHPNESGYAAIANAYYDAIKTYYKGDKSNVEVVALGDSITNGYYNEGYDMGGKGAIRSKTQTYPYKLDALLRNDGFTFENNGEVINAGVSSMQIPSFTSNTNYDKIDEQTDIICLLGGTNDIHQGGGVRGELQTISERMQTLLDTLHAKSPNAMIFLGTMPHFNFIKEDGGITEGGGWWYNKNDFASLQEMEKYNNAQIDAVNGVATKPSTSTIPPADQTVTLNADNNWTQKIDVMPGDTDEYYITEESVPNGWEVSYENNGQVGGSDIVMIAKNTRVIEKTDISVEKTWQGDTTGDQSRNSIKFTLYRSLHMDKNGELTPNPLEWEWEALEDTPTEPTDKATTDIWTFTYKDLPKTDIYGQTYYYKVVEDEIEGYSMTSAQMFDENNTEVDTDVGLTGGTIKITNMRAVSLKIQKEWSDGAENHGSDAVKIQIHRVIVPTEKNPELDLILKMQDSVRVAEGQKVTMTANKEIHLVKIEGNENDRYASVEEGADNKSIEITGSQKGSFTIVVNDGMEDKTITVNVVDVLTVTSTNVITKVGGEAITLNTNRQNISVTPQSSSVFKLDTTGTDANGNATIVITPAGAGNATFIVHDPAGEPENDVEVKVTVVDKLKIAASPSKIVEGAVVTLHTNGLDDIVSYRVNGTPIAGNTVIASEVGSMTIVGSYDNGILSDSDSLVLSVEKFAIQSPSKEVFTSGDREQLNTNAPSGVTVTWEKTEGSDKIKVSESGEVTIENGVDGTETAKMKARFEDAAGNIHEAECTVKAEDDPNAFKVTPKELTIHVNETVTLQGNKNFYWNQGYTEEKLAVSAPQDMKVNITGLKPGDFTLAFVTGWPDDAATAYVLVHIVPAVSSSSAKLAKPTETPMSKAASSGSMVRAGIGLRASAVQKLVKEMDEHDEAVPTISEVSVFTEVNVPVYMAVLPTNTPTLTEEEANSTFDKNGCEFVILNAENGWQKTLNDLAAYVDGQTCYYWAEEVAGPGGYAVCYEFDDGDDTTVTSLNASKIGNANIRIRNIKQQDSGVDLPETGGIGTKPFTAAGVALMAIAAAYPVLTHTIRKKRKRA